MTEDRLTPQERGAVLAEIAARGGGKPGRGASMTPAQFHQRWACETMPEADMSRGEAEALVTAAEQADGVGHTMSAEEALDLMSNLTGGRDIDD